MFEQLDTFTLINYTARLVAVIRQAIPLKAATKISLLQDKKCGSNVTIVKTLFFTKVWLLWLFMISNEKFCFEL